MEGFDFFGGLTVSRELPIFQQFGLVLTCPLY